MAGAPQGYIGRNPSDGRTTINRQTFNVTTGVQTSFTFTSGYDLGYLDVYLNGVKQNETTDYTAADGSTFSFASSTPAVQGDTIEAIAYKSFNTTNVTGSTRDFNVGRNLDVAGNVTIGSSLTIASDLVVNGSYTYVNTEILDIEDKTVGIASTSAASNTTADGAGIVVYGGSDGDKSLTWNRQKSNWVLVGGGVSIGTGCTIGSSTANVLEFSVDGAVNAKLNNYGAFIVGDGVSGEAWGNAYKTVQAGSGAFGGNAPAANAASYWTNNAYFDDVNSRWEYIAADEASRFEQGNGALAYYNASSGSADGAITWSERLRVTAAGELLLGTSTPQGNANANDLVVSTSGNSGITIRSGTSNNGNLFFADGTSGSDEYRGWITYDHSDNKLTFGTNAAERLRIDSAGNVNVTGILTATSFSGPMSGTTGTFTGDVSIADKIVHIGDTDTAIRFPSADTVTIETAGSEALRVDSGGDVNFSGNIQIADTIQHEGDVNTKIRFPSADTVTIETAGTERLRITSDGITKFDDYGGTAGKGRIEFGNSGEQFIEGYDTGNAGSGSYMAFGDGSAEYIRINNTGKVGIGTDSISGNLEVYNHNSLINALTIRTGAGANGYAGLAFASNQTYAREKAAIYFQETNAGAHFTGDLVFATNSASGSATQVSTSDERMRITAAGNVGIGTDAGAASSNSMLTLQTTGSTACRLVLANTGSTSKESTQIYSQNNDLVLNTAASERLRIDSSGNIGQGVTPKTWSLGKAFHVGQVENVMHGESDNGFHMVQNAYYNSGWKKASADLSSIYTQWQGAHIWYTSATGSADAAITWLPKLKIFDNGNIGAGEVTTARANRTFTVSSNGGQIDIHDTDNTTLGIYMNGGNGSFYSRGNSTLGDGSYAGYLTFHTTPADGSTTERLRINSNGTITSTYPTVTTYVDTPADDTSGDRFEITLPDNSRMFRIQGSFSFAGTNTYRIWGDLGSWTDSHTASIEGFANWWEEGAAGPTYQDTISGQYFEVADPVDSQCCEVTYDIVVTSMAFFHGGSENQGGARPGVSGTIRWTRQNEGNALTIFSYQDTNAKATDRLTKFTWDIDYVSGALGAGKHHYVVQALPLTGDAQNLGDAA